MNNYRQALIQCDKAIELSEKSLMLKHQLKLSIFREMLVAEYGKKYGEMWTEKIDKKQAKKLFDEFIVMYQNAFGKPYNNYERRTREYHFQNWKAMMMWDTRKIKVDEK